MSALSYLNKLRGAGIKLRKEGTHLIIEAPSGVITSELRGEMGTRKMDILRALEAESRAAKTDSAGIKEIGVVAGLLAVAYKRYSAIPRLPGQIPNEPDSELALSKDTSVHGGVS